MDHVVLDLIRLRSGYSPWQVSDLQRYRSRRRNYSIESQIIGGKRNARVGGMRRDLFLAVACQILL